MSQKKNIKKLKLKNHEWVNIKKTGREEVAWFESKSSFHPLHYEDCRGKAQHPKIDIADDYAFIALLFPLYNKSTRTIEAAEVDFIITKDTLYTVHDNLLKPLMDMDTIVNTDKTFSLPPKNKTSAVLLYIIIKKLLDYCLPMLDHMSEDISDIEKHLFNGKKEKKMARELLGVKRNIVNFRRTLGSHKNILKKFTETKKPYLRTSIMAPYYIDLIEQTKQIWDLIETHRETINALHETNESIQNDQMNDIMKTLTMFSIIIFSLTLVAAWFSMGADGGRPFINSENSFWIVMFIEFIVIMAILIFFVRKKWLK